MVDVNKKIDYNYYLWQNWLQKWFPLFLITGIITNIIGLFFPILEPDGALYATIAKTMVQSGDFINLKVAGKDWLDKPHFPFWITALSFRLFGITAFAYKIPALIFWAASLVYTYLFARNIYSDNVARLSVLIFITSAHAVISNNDVRAEPYLTALIVGSVFHFYVAAEKKPGIHLLLGSLLAAFAVMTKGPFVLIVIASGFFFCFILQRKWRELYHYRWFLALVLILVFIIPEIYCLYFQFDAHPEKFVFGRTGVSGIRFFFWDSQFGRFLNTGPIKGKGDPFFYMHTLLWAFVPWSLLLFAAIFYRLKKPVNDAFSQGACIILACSLTTILLFSLSRFQLPHYTNIVFPFLAIITADFITRLHHKNTLRAWYIITQFMVCILITSLVVIMALLDLSTKYAVIIFILAVVVLIISQTGKSTVTGIFSRSFLTACLVYTSLNLFIYPALMAYQSGMNAAKYVNNQRTRFAVGTFREDSYSFAFYLDKPVEYHSSPETIKASAARGETLIFLKHEDIGLLSKEGLNVTILRSFPHFHISQLTYRFLNRKTRNTEVSEMIVAKIQ